MKTANLNPKTYRLAISVAAFAILILFASTLSVRDSSAKPINEGVNQVAPTPTTAFTPTPITHSDSWRLPFDGEKRIWNGPGEGLHIGNSSEAMDFLSPVGAADHFNIVAPPMVK